MKLSMANRTSWIYENAESSTKIKTPKPETEINDTQILRGFIRTSDEINFAE